MNKLSKYKFKTQLYIYFSLIIVIVVSAIMGSLYLILKNYYYEQQRNILANQAKQILTNVENRLDYYDSYLELLLKDPALRAMLQTGTKEEIEKEFELITKNFHEFNLGKVLELTIQEVSEESTKEISYNEPFQTSGTFLNNRNERLFSLYKIMSIPDNKKKYKLEIVLYETEIFALFSKDKSGNRILVTQNKDLIISSSERELFHQILQYNLPVDRKQMEQNKKPIEIKAQSKYGWTVCIYTDSSYLEKGYFEMVKTLLPIIFLVLLFVMFIVSFITKHLNLRLKFLQEKIASIGSQDFYKNINMDGEDEFSVLSDEVDNARVQIYKLLEEIREVNRKERISNMIALRAQISSHFLFNALASIKWLAKQEQKEHSVSEAIDQLAIFLRYSIAIDENLVLVNREVDQLNAYIYLQKLRSGENLHVVVDIDDETLEYKTVKLILQPIVENAFFHAKKGECIPLHIMIYSYSDEEYYYLVVEDDGRGISNETMAELLSGKEETENRKDGGYGLKNVIKRLDLCTYGTGSLTIESTVDKFTKITIKQKTIR